MITFDSFRKNQTQPGSSYLGSVHSLKGLSGLYSAVVICLRKSPAHVSLMFLLPIQMLSPETCVSLLSFTVIVK